MSEFTLNPIVLDRLLTEEALTNITGVFLDDSELPIDIVEYINGVKSSLVRLGIDLTDFSELTSKLVDRRAFQLWLDTHMHHYNPTQIVFMLDQYIKVFRYASNGESITINDKDGIETIQLGSYESSQVESNLINDARGRIERIDSMLEMELPQVITYNNYGDIVDYVSFNMEYDDYIRYIDNLAVISILHYNTDRTTKALKWNSRLNPGRYIADVTIKYMYTQDHYILYNKDEDQLNVTFQGNSGDINNLTWKNEAIDAFKIGFGDGSLRFNGADLSYGNINERVLKLNLIVTDECTHEELDDIVLEYDLDGIRLHSKTDLISEYYIESCYLIPKD